MRRSNTGFTFVVGNMFGSKTSRMIHLLNLEKEMEGKVQAFKTTWDNRYGESEIVTHDGTSFPATAVKDTSGLLKCLKGDTEVIGIDEVPFFDEQIKDFILENKDKYLIIATALQLDFRGNPFPLRSPRGEQYDSEVHVGELMPYARIITEYPQCIFKIDGGFCRAYPAIYVQRFRPDGSLAPYSDPTVVVGGKDKYAPRCIEHFTKPE